MILWIVWVVCQLDLLTLPLMAHLAGGQAVLGGLRWWLCLYLRPWQRWLEGRHLTLSTWSLILPLSNPSCIHGGWLLRQWKGKLQGLLNCRDLLLWNKTSPNNSTIYLIYLLVILQFNRNWLGELNESYRIQVPGLLTWLTPQLGWLNSRSLARFLSLHALCHHSVI